MVDVVRATVKKAATSADEVVGVTIGGRTGVIGDHWGDQGGLG